MPSQKYKRCAVTFQDSIGLPIIDDPWIGEQIMFYFFSKQSCWPTWNLCYRFGALQISENNNTNSKRGFHSVKNTPTFFKF